MCYKSSACCVITKLFYLVNMKLELLLENSNNPWPLTPDKYYVIGSDTSCAFTLPSSESVRGQHLKFSFDQTNNCWLVEDLSGRRGTIVNNMLVATALIKGITRIVISDEVVIIAKPEFATAPPVAAPVIPPPVSAPTLVAQQPIQPLQNYGTPDFNIYNSGYSTPPSKSGNFPSPAVARNEISSGVSRASAKELLVLTWPQYVQKQIKEHGKNSVGMSWAINFALKTGFRNTPWMKEIDGYIIPNFRGSAESVALGIEQELGFLRQYEETDCYISAMTDAHIADSGSQSFLGVELFPIIRSRKHNKGDYRKFCVTAHHRVKTYLLVEKYGDDLFVSWVTRFEPIPTSLGMTLLMLLAIISFLVLIIPLSAGGIKGLMIASFPFLLWWEIFHFTPMVMSSMKILPKKANAKLVIGVMLSISMLGILFFLALPNEAFLMLAILIPIMLGIFYVAKQSEKTVS
jgi:FHA domain